MVVGLSCAWSLVTVGDMVFTSSISCPTADVFTGNNTKACWKLSPAVQVRSLDQQYSPRCPGKRGFNQGPQTAAVLYQTCTSAIMVCLKHFQNLKWRKSKTEKDALTSAEWCLTFRANLEFYRAFVLQPQFFEVSHSSALQHALR